MAAVQNKSNILGLSRKLGQQSMQFRPTDVLHFALRVSRIIRNDSFIQSADFSPGDGWRLRPMTAEIEDDDVPRLCFSNQMSLNRINDGGVRRLRACQDQNIFGRKF